MRWNKVIEGSDFLGGTVTWLLVVSIQNGSQHNGNQLSLNDECQNLKSRQRSLSHVASQVKMIYWVMNCEDLEGDG
jgi:hypothetical protein